MRGLIGARFLDAQSVDHILKDVVLGRHFDIRETLEETGAIIKNNIRKIGTLKIIWGKDWAKTEKQKARYDKYQGDEMNFFTGEIKEFKQLKRNSKSKKLMQIEKAIEIIENSKAFSKESEEYHNFQLNILNEEPHAKSIGYRLTTTTQSQTA